MFVSDDRSGGDPSEQTVSVPSARLVLFGYDEVLQLRFILLVIIPNPHAEITDKLLYIETVLLFLVERERDEIFPLLAESQLPHPRP